MDSPDVFEIPKFSNPKQIICLDLYGTEIYDYEPIVEFENLKKLSLDGKRAGNISGISFLKHLESLKIRRLYYLGEVCLFESLQSLVELDLTGGEISDLNVISGLIKLKKLSLSENQITDLSPIKNISRLVELNLDRNNISDIFPISNLLRIESLILDNNQVNDLVPLSNLAYLEKLSLRSNKISDIRPLSSINKLKSLDLSGNQLIYFTLKWLQFFTNLDSIKLAGNPIQNIPKEIFDKAK